MYAELLHLSVQEMLAMAEVLQNNRKGFRKTIAAMAGTERFNMTQLFLMSLALDTTNEWIDAFTWAVGCRKVCCILQSMEVTLQFILSKEIPYEYTVTHILGNVHSQDPFRVNDFQNLDNGLSFHFIICRSKE